MDEQDALFPLPKRRDDAWLRACAALIKRIWRYREDRALDLEMQSPSLAPADPYFKNWAAMVAHLKVGELVLHWPVAWPVEEDGPLVKCDACQDTLFQIRFPKPGVAVGSACKKCAAGRELSGRRARKLAEERAQRLRESKVRERASKGLTPAFAAPPSGEQQREAPKEGRRWWDD